MRRQRAVSLAKRINPGDPEAAGLVACFVTTPGGMVDIVRGVVGTRFGTADPTRSTSDGTLEAYFDGVDDGWGFGSSLVLSTSAPFTIAWESILDAGVDFRPGIITVPTSSATNELELAYSTNAGYKDINFGSDAAWVNSVKAALPSHISFTGMRHWGVLTFDGVSATSISSFRAYVNGEELTLSSGSSFGAKGDSTTRIGNNPTSTTVDWDGGIRQVRVYDRAWSQAEAVRFFHPRTRDALFSPRSARIYSFGPPAASGRTGTLAATESGSDTATFAGDVIVQGALSASEAGADTAAIAGDVLVRGALAATESGADTAALTGDVLVQGALAATETGSDTAAFLGSGTTPAITGTLAATESGADVAALAGVVRISGALAATETGADTAAFTSAIPASGISVVRIVDVSTYISIAALPEWPRVA